MHYVYGTSLLIESTDSIIIIIIIIVIIIVANVLITIVLNVPSIETEIILL